MRFLVTGTGRCGTLYAAKYLQAMGLDIQHEKMGRNGTANWWLAVPWSLSPLPIFDKVVHIIREPVATISSLTACHVDHEIWEHVIPNTPVLETDPLLLRCMKLWHYWNLICEGLADVSFRIEDWDLHVQAVFSVNGPAPNIPKDTHTWKQFFTPVTWEQCAEMDWELTRLVRKQARRYGYSVEETHLDSRQHV